MSELGEQEPIDPIVEANLRIIEEQMPKLLNSESIGGNAGKIDLGGKKYSCSGANVSVDRYTGEIKQFGSILDISPDVRDNRRNIRGTFKVVYNTAEFQNKDLSKAFSPIVSFSVEDEIKKGVKERILKAADEYNQKHAPQLPVNLFEES